MDRDHNRTLGNRRRSTETSGAGVLKCCAVALFFLTVGSPAQAIKIGVMNDQAGPYSSHTGVGSVDAARMAIEDFGGSVLGSPIELVAADHQNKPDVGLVIARRWFDTEGVDVIVDVPTSSVALAVQQLVRDRQKLVIFSGPGASDLTGKACSPFGIAWTYDSYAIIGGSGSGRIAGRLQDLVFPDRGFRLRSRDGARCDISHSGRRRHCDRHGAASLQHGGSFVVSADGAEFEGRHHRVGQCRPRCRQFAEASQGVRHHGRRPTDRGVAAVDH